MHPDVLVELLAQLHSKGYKDSKGISLEEQVAIFLYTVLVSRV